MPTQLPRVPSLIPSSFATLAIGRDVSITIFTASSLNSGERLFIGRGNYFTFPDGPSYWMDCPEGSGHLNAGGAGSSVALGGRAIEVYQPRGSGSYQIAGIWLVRGESSGIEPGSTLQNGAACQVRPRLRARHGGRHLEHRQNGDT